MPKHLHVQETFNPVGGSSFLGEHVNLGSGPLNMAALVGPDPRSITTAGLSLPAPREFPLGVEVRPRAVLLVGHSPGNQTTHLAAD